MRKLSRTDWIVGAFDALCEGGIEALRVEPLAKRLGVTKGSFYHHFQNRRALHMAILGEWERLGTSLIIEDVSHGDDPVEQIHALAIRTLRADPVTDAIETNIRAWAATDEEVSAAVGRVDERRLEFAASLLRQSGLPAPLAERRARLIYRVLIGEFMWRSAGGPTTTRRELDELVELVTTA
jgi:AcrR family transcriptional regulator